MSTVRSRVWYSLPLVLTGRHGIWILVALFSCLFHLSSDSWYCSPSSSSGLIQWYLADILTQLITATNVIPMSFVRITALSHLYTIFIISGTGIIWLAIIPKCKINSSIITPHKIALCITVYKSQPNLRRFIISSQRWAPEIVHKVIFSFTMYWNKMSPCEFTTVVPSIWPRFRPIKQTVVVIPIVGPIYNGQQSTLVKHASAQR